MYFVNIYAGHATSNRQDARSYALMEQILQSVQTEKFRSGKRVEFKHGQHLNPFAQWRRKNFARGDTGIVA